MSKGEKGHTGTVWQDERGSTTNRNLSRKGPRGTPGTSGRPRANTPPGRYKTQELITRNYWWPYIQADIHKYISGCKTCQRTKTHQEKPHNPLQPNEIPTVPWEHISVDIIREIPESKGFNVIIVITDKHGLNGPRNGQDLQG